MNPANPPPNFAEVLDAADYAHQAASEFVPSNESWGLQFHDNPNFVLANDFTGFIWFETREALLDHVERVIVLPGNAGAEEEDLRAAREAAAAVARQARQTGTQIAPGTAFDIIGRTLTVTWMGRFGDLLLGAGEFEISLRREYRERNEDDSDEPIEPSEQDDFLDFLRSYGV